MGIIYMNKEEIEGVPDGWRLVRIGKASVGEWVIDIYGKPHHMSIDQSSDFLNRVVIEKIVKYRDVTIDDVGKMVEIETIAGGGSWIKAKLLAILPEDMPYRYIYETHGNNWACTDGKIMIGD